MAQQYQILHKRKESY